MTEHPPLSPNFTDSHTSLPPPPSPTPAPPTSRSAHPSGGPPFDASLFDYVLYVDDLDGIREQWTDDRAFLPAVLTYGLAFVVGVVGNLFVVGTAVCGDRKSARSATSSFLVSLAVADVAFLVVCVPYEIVAKLSTGWSVGLTVCKLTGFVEMLSAAASVLNLTAVTVERYAHKIVDLLFVCVCLPLYACLWMSVCLPVCLHACLSVCVYLYLCVCLCVCVCVCVCLYVCVCLSACASVYLSV